MNCVDMIVCVLILVWNTEEFGYFKGYILRKKERGNCDIIVRKEN